MGINKNLMKFNKILILILCFIVCLSLVSAEITILHEFNGAVDGRNPYDSLILDSGNLYGMTAFGGYTDNGTIFSIGVDGSNYKLLHEFNGTVDDGMRPYGSLILDSGKLYGMTTKGGDQGNGVIFSIGTDGGNFSLLHEFLVVPHRARIPYGSLILDSNTLYGMTQYGANYRYGTIFSIGTDGNGFSVLHEFVSDGIEGKKPEGDLLLDSGKLYGMTQYGGSFDKGTIFSIGTDGTGLSVLYDFEGGVDDGSYPHGSLILDSGKFYGMTSRGGDSDYGVIFSIGVDGSNYTLLHEFAGGVDDGRTPYYGKLILVSGKLYGMAMYGGDLDTGGVVFSIGTDGSGFSLLHKFVGGIDDGLRPRGSLIFDSGKFYGMTGQGGDLDFGTVFSIQLGSNEPTYSNFIPSAESTNFSAVDVTNVTSLTLAIENKGKIAFSSGHSINADGEDYDTNVKIEDAMIYVDSAALDSSFNDSATLTFYNVDCNKPYVFYSETASTFASILSENQRCLAPLCTNIECSSGTLTVDVEHFTGFAAGADANLTTEAEAGVFYPLDPIEFTAEYINSTDGTPISGECNISFDDAWGTWFEMDFNSTDYNYTKSFAAAGLHEYNVTCSSANFVTLEANDTKLVSSVDIPEFSTITLGLGLIAVLGGLFVIRKRK